MPELPEVETIRRQLEPRVVGRVIFAVDVLDERWAQGQSAVELARLSVGRSVEAVERRGKHLLLRLSGESTLLMHLRMTGNIIHVDPTPDGSGPRPIGKTATRETATRETATRETATGEGAPGERHLRAVITLDRGELRFRDPRRFGHGRAMPSGEADRHLDERLGVEPLSSELTAELIGDLAGRRTAPLKSFLLAQEGIAGIGNIYADEALHRAALHPLSPAGSMREEHREALRSGIVGALEAGLDNGGASMDDYLDLDGERGSMQDEFLVHTREGLPCGRCGEAVRRTVVGGRSTYFCPSCQVRLRRRPRRRAGRRAIRAAGGTR